MNMKEAYLKVLGLDQKPLEEKKMGRPGWVPESIGDDQVSDFMGALASAHKEGCDTFKFGDKSYKMTVNKPTNEAKEIDFDDPKGDTDKESEEDDEIIVKGKGKKEVEEKKDCNEELTDKQKKIDHNKNGKIDGEDLAKLRNEETDDEHYARQSPRMQTAINLHLRKGKSYKDAVAAAKVHVKEEKYSALTATLSEGGFTAEEIDEVIAKLEEAHVGTGGPAAAEAQDMGDNLSDGELDFIDTHEVEVVDGTPEKPDHDKDVDAATAPSAQGAGTVEIDGKKAAAADAVNPVKSQASVPAGKGAAKVEIDGAKDAEEDAKTAAKKVG